jgi:hypothetical protein
MALDVIDEVAEELEGDAALQESALNIAREAQNNALAVARAESSAVRAFSQKFLGSAKSCGQWLSSCVKSQGFGNVLNMTMLGGMIWQLVKANADQAAQTGQLVKLSAAITGAEATVKTNFQSVVSASQSIINGPSWSSISPTDQATFQENVALGPDGYWALQAPTLMAALAQAPQYDASA